MAIEIDADEFNDENYDRITFGRSALPLWSDLTPFEELVLSGASLAQKGDADALLALYIAAAGSHRDMESFEQLNQLLDQWVAKLEKPLRRKRKLADKGKLLHDAMHRDFFLIDDDGDSLIGYDADQSQFPEIFKSQQFNCISSSLLYLVLARKIDLPVNAVLLPSHTYVQLLDKNAVVEVETTSIHGYDVEHNEDFYANSDQEWFDERNLEATTYQDYLDRDIISAYEIGLYNMWSQHTSPERMPYRDRFRLAEIRGVLQASDINAQLNRLNYYLLELGQLNRERDIENAFRLTQTIFPYLESLQNRLEESDQLRDLWLGTQTEISLAKIQQGEFTSGFRLAKKSLELLDPNLEGYERHHNNLMIVVSNYVTQSLEHNNFAQLRLSLMDIEQACIDNPACSQSMGQLYGAWAQAFWDQEDWHNASRILTEYVQFNIDDQNNAVFRSNAEMAFVNDAKVVLWDGDWKDALNRLQQCVDQLLGETRCSAQIKYIKEQRHLGNL